MDHTMGIFIGTARDIALRNRNRGKNAQHCCAMPERRPLLRLRYPQSPSAGSVYVLPPSLLRDMDVYRTLNNSSCFTRQRFHMFDSLLAVSLVHGVLCNILRVLSAILARTCLHPKMARSLLYLFTPKLQSLDLQLVRPVISTEAQAALPAMRLILAGAKGCRTEPRKLLGSVTNSSTASRCPHKMARFSKIHTKGTR